MREFLLFIVAMFFEVGGLLLGAYLAFFIFIGERSVEMAFVGLFVWFMIWGVGTYIRHYINDEVL